MNFLGNRRQVVTLAMDSRLVVDPNAKSNTRDEHMAFIERKEKSVARNMSRQLGVSPAIQQNNYFRAEEQEGVRFHYSI